jgi:hypothetical protein
MICEELCNDENAAQTNRTDYVKEKCVQQLRKLMNGEFTHFTLSLVLIAPTANFGVSRTYYNSKFRITMKFIFQYK